MIIDLKDLDDLRLQILDLERGISDLSQANKSYYEDLNRSVDKVSKSLRDSIDTTSVKKLDSIVSDIATKVTVFSSAVLGASASLQKIAGVSGDLSGITGELGTVSKSFSKLHDVAVKAAKDAAKKESWKGRHPHLAKELSGAGRIVKSYARKLHIPTPGNIAGGTIMASAFAFLDTQRLMAEAGKAKNVLVASADGALKDVVGVATEWLSGFGERMEKFFGISAASVRDLQNTFTQAGIKISDTILTKVNPAFKQAGENMVAYSLSIDKLFERATGTTAKLATEYTEKFGESIGESHDAIVKLLAAGSGESGVGSLKYLEYIGQTKDALANMGYRLSDVIDLSYALSEQWRKIGVPKHLAVRMVGEGIKGIANGLASMSKDWMSVFAEKAGYGTGAEGRIKAEDSMLRLTNKYDGQFATDMIKFGRGILAESGNDEFTTRELLEKAGFGVDGSRLLMEMVKLSEKTGPKAKEELKAKVLLMQAKVVKALEVEREKMTPMQVYFNEWLVAVRNFGMGVLGLVSDTLGLIIGFFRALPTLIYNIVNGDVADNAEVMEKVWSVQNFKSHGIRIKKSSKAMIKIGKKMKMDVEDGKDSINPLQGLMEAMTVELPGPRRKTDAAQGSNQVNVGSSPSGGNFTVLGLTTTAVVDKVKDMLGSDSAPKMPKKNVPSAPYTGEDDTDTGYDAYAGDNIANDYEDDAEAPPQTAGGPSGGGAVGSSAPEAPPPPYTSSGGYASDQHMDDPTTIEGAKAAYNANSLVIVDKGTDEQGNINVSVEGACPGCAQPFGSDVEHVGHTMKFRNRRTGKSITTDPTTELGMAELSKLSVGRKVPVGEQTNALDSKLGGILAQVSQAFPGREIQVIKGAGRATGKKEHAKGRALDFAVKGVGSKELMTWLHQNIKGGGKGYYPNQDFVHVDVSDKPRNWVDKALRGQESTRGKGGTVLSNADAQKYFAKEFGNSVK